MEKSEDGNEAAKIAVYKYEYGKHLISVGKYEEAIVLFKDSLKLKKKLYGSDHLQYADMLYALGSLYEEAGNKSKALNAYQRCLQVDKKLHDPADIADTLHVIAGLYADEGNHGVALALYEDSIRIDKEIHGANADHADIATTLNNIAAIYRNQDSLEKAMEVFNECLKMKLRIYSHDHPSVATTLSNIADVHDIMGHHEEALAMYQESYRILQSVYPDGYDHIAKANALFDLARIRSTQGQFALALMALIECYYMRRRLLLLQQQSATNPATAAQREMIRTVLNCMVAVYSRMEDRYVVDIDATTRAEEVRVGMGECVAVTVGMGHQLPKAPGDKRTHPSYEVLIILS